MYRKLKQKLMLLICMFGVLCLLISQNKSIESELDEEIGNGEVLKLPILQENEDISTEKELEAWDFTEENPTIRVLILDENGTIYHKEKSLEKVYEGEVEFYETEQGFVIVNELPLESYLCYVVPSEMPSTYATEALKAQAVCARTYAVWHLQEYAYPEYEAHVDDSVSYQVYHQIDSQASTNQAVEDTKGQILIYENAPVKTYYFSTSCGITSNELIWEKGEYNPYLNSIRIGTSSSKKDFTKEEVFEKFIKKKHAGDIEISEPWYRWSCYVPLTQIEKNVKTWANVRAGHSADGVLLQGQEQEGDTYVWNENNEIGNVKNVKILTRNDGGVAHELLITGEQGVLKVKYEYNIRLMLGIPDGTIQKNDGTNANLGNLLPSGYFVMEEVYRDDTLTGYQIYGGGLGHGVGMSQNGARILAEQGANYEEILKYFYQDIQLAQLGKK